VGSGARLFLDQLRLIFAELRNQFVELAETAEELKGPIPNYVNRDQLNPGISP